MKKVLIISYYFPPAGGPGVQRWLKFVKYLRKFGIEPVMYVPENADYPIIDPSLEGEIPKGLKVFKGKIVEPNRFLSHFSGAKKTSAGFIDSGKKGFVSGILTWIRANVFIPDARMLWIRPSVDRVERIIKEEKIDTIISTGPPHSTHMIALGVKKRQSHIRWIADFRDPWTKIDYFHHLPLCRWAKKRHFTLEQEVLDTADDILVVTNSMADDYRGRSETPVHTITNGFDEQDLPNEEVVLDEKFTIAHIGSLNADRNPRELWEVLRTIKEENTSFAEDLEIKLVGNIADDVIRSLEENNLLANTNLVGYLSHSKVIEIQHSSRALLMMMNRTPDGRMYIAGKLFEYIASGRPVLLVGFQKSDAADILREAENGFCVDFEDKKGLYEAVISLYKSYKEGLDTSKRSEKIDQFSREALTRRLASLLDGSQTRDISNT